MKRTGDDIVYCKNGEEKNKVFMCKKGQMKYKYVKIKKGNDFKIIIVPFEKEDGRINRVMVYLIPNNKSYDLNLLWSNFTDYTKGDIEAIINKCKLGSINLHVPKIERFVSQMNITDIFAKIYDLKGSDLKVNMTTLIDVCEEGDSHTECCLMKIPSRNYEVKINVPHIAMVYDFSIERILLLIKYTGINSE